MQDQPVRCTVFIFVMGLAMLTTMVLFVIDVTQRHAIRRNYPVIGRFRYWFERLGEFFRSKRKGAGQSTR